ncbi:hemerythrin domain-containing protein [Sphingobium sp.]|uniref:hemerythrin domain-containing protein n=1 Tax=Sphingobium sp. TaxID=1912891 RepID=UPI002606A9AA|nr:hemerythrin domain-containing protein [Sphingobium sp.]
MDIGELRLQHAEIGRAADRLAELTAIPDKPTTVGAIRWHLARLLMTHLALEDRILYPALLQADDADVRAATQTLQIDTGRLAEHFSLYMTAWSDDRIAREWPSFCRETHQMLSTLRKRIEREEETLYPLADQIRHPVRLNQRTG